MSNDRIDKVETTLIGHGLEIARHTVEISQLKKRDRDHADHHLEMANTLNEFRSARETQRAENALMIESIKAIVSQNTRSSVDVSNYLQVVVLVLVAAIYVGGERLGIGLAGIGAAEAAVVGLAAWFVRSAKKAGLARREGSGFSFPPYKNGGG